jgi:ribosome maturation factor RimP
MTDAASRGPSSRGPSSRGAVSRDRVRDVLSPVVSAAGFDLEDVAVTAAGRRHVVKVVVDRDGGLDLDAVAEVSRVVAAALDDTDATGDAPYTLEVTSPGVDRPLTEPRHWRRARGRLVKAGTITGRVLDADDQSVRLELDGGETRDIPYADLGAGKVQVEFS